MSFYWESFAAAGLSGTFGWGTGIREALMISMAALSWYSTRRAIHDANHFHFHPIAEVAALFIGIFITMIPALEILNQRAVVLDLREPWQYFWMSGVLSSFLDNAPTYLAFSAMASGLVGGGADNLSILVSSAFGESLLTAVSCGSVFMGANTYIGNGPNFMVKSIAESSGIKMPTFAGYMLYSGAILTPIFVLVDPCFFFDSRYVLYFSTFMTDRPICKSSDHLFVPILEVSVPLLRCIHCNVFAYHDTVKQLAKNRSYTVDDEPRLVVTVPYWRRMWINLRRTLGFTGSS